MNDQFPITQTMQDNIKFLSINSQIISGVLQIRADRDGNMPTDEDIRRRFWGAYNRLTEEVRNIQAQRKADNLRADNQKLQERIKELEAQAVMSNLEKQATTKGKSKTPADDNLPF